ncbi:MAG: FAD-binding protein [Pyrobaculum sp.]|nr:FAD-binding protein [Pyrobaculum sp.]
MSVEVVRALEDVVGERVYTDADVLRLYSRDASSESGELPLAVVEPVDVDEVVKIVKLAIQYNKKVVVVGASTSLSGNAAPKTSDAIVVSMAKMNNIIEVSEVDWYARVQPGVRVDELNLELARYGLQWPVDPASSKAATVGGVISNGGGGVKGAKYGPASHWVLALQAVIGTGDVINVGCYTVKCREGYNLLQLFIGSEGTLGVITEAALRLAPLPQSFVGVLGQFNNVEDLVSTVIDIRKAKLWIVVNEFLDDRTSQLVGLDNKFHLWLGVDVNAGCEDKVLEQFKNSVAKNRGEVVGVAYSLGEFNKLLEPRRRLYYASLQAAFNDYGRNALVFIEDVAVPMSRLPNAVRELMELSNKYGIEMVIGGHIGDGNIHPTIWVNKSDKKEVEKAVRLFEEIGKIGIKYGGTVSAEHGIGSQKKELLKEALAAKNQGNYTVLYNLMAQIKKALDPHGVFNPGKIL